MTGWLFALVLYLLGMVYVKVAIVAAYKANKEITGPTAGFAVLLGWPIVALWILATVRRKNPDA